MLNPNEIKASFKNFYTYLEGVLDDLTRELRQQSRGMMKDISTQRDMVATGKWSSTSNLKLKIKRKFKRVYEIMNVMSGFGGMEDARNVGTRPFLPNKDAIKNWVIIRGIADDKDVDRVTYLIRRSIMQRGLTPSSIKLYNGSTVNYDETIYEKLSKLLFDRKSIIKFLDERINKYHG